MVTNNKDKIKNENQEEFITDLKIADNGFPEFSWDKMPQYLHVRKHKGYTPEEIKFISQFPLITLEKSQAWQTYGSTEDGANVTAEAVKKINDKASILYYRNTIINWPTYKYDKAFVKDNPNALLRNEDNELVYMPNGKTPYFDITKDFVKEYWLNSVMRMIYDTDNFDGVFLDANIKLLAKGYFKNRVGSEKQVALEKSYFAMMVELKSRLAGKKIMLSNIIRVRPDFKETGLEYMNYFDGSYLEAFDAAHHGMSYQDYLAKGIDAVQKAAKQGKIIAMTLGLGKAVNNALDAGIDDVRKGFVLDRSMNARVDYLSAIFLVCAERHSYLSLHGGYNAANSPVWLKTFHQFKRPLGAPKGDATKDGYIYTRSFENLDVRLNIENKTAVLTWKDPVSDSFE